MVFLNCTKRLVNKGRGGKEGQREIEVKREKKGSEVEVKREKKRREIEVKREKKGSEIEVKREKREER
jgi:hypothetical protein